MKNDIKPFIQISDEVAEAISNKKAIVCLESSIFCQGLPLDVAFSAQMELQEVVRKNKAVPATMALLHGRVHVGLDEKETGELIDLRQANALFKISSRDLGFALVARQSGGTTVASTIYIAAHLGLKVFATGGLGGVHRGYHQTFDISTDLLELSRRPVSVVCGGVKSILDIENTLEVLESYAVPVVGYQCHEFPGFYYRKTGFKNLWPLEEIAQIAQLIQTRDALGFSEGIVVAHPIAEEAEIPKSEIEPLIEDALKEAEKASIRGKAVTPYLLKVLAEKTHRRSVKANLSLLKQNYEIGARLACAYADLNRT